MKFPLILIFLISSISSAYSAELILDVNHLFVNQSLVLDSAKYKAKSGEIVTLSKVKYYLGNIKLTYSSGKSFVDPQAYHLIEVKGAEPTQLRLKDVPQGNITSIQFGLGVDSLTNDKGLIEGDLDPMNGMYWSWSSGFINIKLEGVCHNCSGKNKEFNYHIGGFQAPNQTYIEQDFPLTYAVKAKTQKLALNVDLAKFFNSLVVNDLPRLMSPSVTAVKLGKMMMKTFNIKP